MTYLIPLDYDGAIWWKRDGDVYLVVKADDVDLPDSDMIKNRFRYNRSGSINYDIGFLKDKEYNCEAEITSEDVVRTYPAIKIDVPEYVDREEPEIFIDDAKAYIDIGPLSVGEYELIIELKDVSGNIYRIDKGKITVMTQEEYDKWDGSIT